MAQGTDEKRNVYLGNILRNLRAQSSTAFNGMLPKSQRLTAYKECSLRLLQIVLYVLRPQRP